jgi:hypothetical protein
MRYTVPLLLSLLSLIPSAICLAQEDVEDGDSVDSNEKPAALSLAVWCEIDVDNSGDKICDMGVGLAFYSFRLPPSLSGDIWVSIVGVLGGETTGIGIGITVIGTDKIRVTMAVGGTVRYDLEFGIDLTSASPAAGVTFGFRF